MRAKFLVLILAFSSFSAAADPDSCSSSIQVAIRDGLKTSATTVDDSRLSYSWVLTFTTNEGERCSAKCMKGAGRHAWTGGIHCGKKNYWFMTNDSNQLFGFSPY